MKIYETTAEKFMVRYQYKLCLPLTGMFKDEHMRWMNGIQIYVHEKYVTLFDNYFADDVEFSLDESL